MSTALPLRLAATFTFALPLAATTALSLAASLTATFSFSTAARSHTSAGTGAFALRSCSITTWHSESPFFLVCTCSHPGVVLQARLSTRTIQCSVHVLREPIVCFLVPNYSRCLLKPTNTVCGMVVEFGHIWFDVEQRRFVENVDVLNMERMPFDFQQLDHR